MERSRKEKRRNLTQGPDGFLDCSSRSFLGPGCVQFFGFHQALSYLRTPFITSKITNISSCFCPYFACKGNWGSGKLILLQVLMVVFLNSSRTLATQVKLETKQYKTKQCIFWLTYLGIPSWSLTVIVVNNCTRMISSNLTLFCQLWAVCVNLFSEEWSLNVGGASSHWQPKAATL